MEDSMEKDNFLRNWDREFQTTIKVLKAYPLERQDYKPHEKSKSAKDLSWIFAAEEKSIISGIITGQIDFRNMPSPPENMKECISEFEKLHKENFNKMKNMPVAELNKTMKFPIGPKKMGDLRKIDVLWFLLMDQIHHRGQFSVYIRLAGGKIPSIYGPTADESW